MYGRIKSIEIFPNLFPPFEEIGSFPQSLLDLVQDFIEDDRITVRVYAELDSLERIYNECLKYDIRCQKYLI